MLEFIFELLFEFFGEFLLQLLSEFLGGVFRAGWKKARPAGALEGSVLREVTWSVGSGAVAGLITVWFFPVLVIQVPWLRLVNLLAAPLAAGLLVERFRAWRERGTGPLCEPDFEVFAYAALFGFAFALTRFLLAH